MKKPQLNPEVAETLKEFGLKPLDERMQSLSDYLNSARVNAAAKDTASPEVTKARVKRILSVAYTASPPTKESKTSVAATGDGVPLKRICAAINLDPRLARRILRAKGAKPGGRWEWPEAEVDRITKILQASEKKS